MTNIVCISHSEDVDGLVCASLLKMAKNAQCVLAGYPNLVQKLKSITEETDTVYLCDLSLDAEVLEELRRIHKLSEITYVDHHPIRSGILRSLKSMEINVVHSTQECAGELTYDLLRRDLPDNALLLPSYARLSDYPYGGQRSRLDKMGIDHHLTRLESELLYYSVAKASEDYAFKNGVVDGLSRLRYPHEIGRVLEFAKQEVEYLVDLARNIHAKASFCNNLAHVEVSGNTGVVANALLHAVSKPVLVCYKMYEEGESCYLSVRTREDRHDLNTIVSGVAEKLGGTGGGHPLAAAAQIPAKNFVRFIALMDRAFGSTTQTID